MWEIGNAGDRSASGLYVWHNGDTLIKAAAAVYSTVIVVVHTVGPILVENWIDLPAVKAVVFAHLPGQEAGESLTDILFGDFGKIVRRYNPQNPEYFISSETLEEIRNQIRQLLTLWYSAAPSGHLPYSIPMTESNYPASVGLVGFEAFQVQDTYSEGLYIDYRYLNKHQIAPRYAFGHGLSYTSFSRTSPTISAVTALSSIPPLRPAKGSTPVYNDSIPPAVEVAWPAGFTAIWRYLYPYLDHPENIKPNGSFAYPTGYQTAPQPDPPAGGDQGGNPALWDTMFTITVNVTNTGKVAGKDVVMVFVQFRKSLLVEPFFIVVA